MTGEPKIENGKLSAIVKAQLINRMNVLHFADESFLVLLRHQDHDFRLQLRAAPHPCVDENVTATWLKEEIFPPDLDSYELENIIIPGTRRTIEFLPNGFHVDTGGIRLSLPEEAYEVSGRKAVRHICRQQGLNVSLVQHSVAFDGQLLDFSPQALRVKLRAADPQNFFWLNPDLPAMLMISSEGKPIYSGQVKILYRDSDDSNYQICILEPLETMTPRFQPKKHRARREQFKPSPDLVFNHPLTGRKCTIKVETLGSLGFSVIEHEMTSVLMAGILLPNTQLSFANSLCLDCTAQVVYRVEMKDGTVRLGIAILDIDIQDHLKLISLIQQAQDQHAYVSNQVEPEALFEFFFETGFLYPHKYSEVASNREEFKNAYLRLYEQGSNLSRHFVYQDNGYILGHFATIRTHKSTWMNHHHAALPDSRAGLKVVRAISEFINDSYFLNPTNLKYIIGFYRPENRFPNKFFGGFVDSAKDKKITSIDTFGYLKQADQIGKDWAEKPGEWEIARATDSDIFTFRGFYKKKSGGLMANAFDLAIDSYDDPALANAYDEAGLKRHRFFYAIRLNNTIKALIEVQDSALGLNMSELTNAIICYVIDEDAFHDDVFRLVIFALATKYNKQDHPVLIYPHSYVEKYKIKTDKDYNLWALDLKHSEHYMTWLYRYCRKL